MRSCWTGEISASIVMTSPIEHSAGIWGSAASISLRGAMFFHRSQLRRSSRIFCKFKPPLHLVVVDQIRIAGFDVVSLRIVTLMAAVVQMVGDAAVVEIEASREKKGYNEQNPSHTRLYEKKV